MKNIHFYLPGGRLVYLGISAKQHPDYSCVNKTRSLNTLRQWLAAIGKAYRKHNRNWNWDFSYQLSVSYDTAAKEYWLSAYTQNYGGFASFLGGILFATRFKKKKRKIDNGQLQNHL